MNRREMMGAAALTAASYSRVKGANDRVVVGLIGCGGRGRYVARMMREAPNVSFGAVCDVYERNAAMAREWAGTESTAYGDFRKVLERKDIDAVLVATPDHWHAIPTILACEAGKDVYVEKPLAHNVREGRAIVEAAKRSKRIVQTGTQHRSATHFQEVAKIIQSGELGEVRYVRVWNFTNLTPNGIGTSPDAPVPDGLDWDMYLGPAPKVPFNPKRLGATYRWFWDYAGGTISDFGVHRFDTVHQIMGVDAPLKVSAMGHRYALKDAGEMPDVLQVTYDYPGFVMSYEACNLSAHGLGGRSPGMQYYNARGTMDRPHGEAYYGTNGALFADRIGYEIFPDPKPDPNRFLRTDPTTGTTSGAPVPANAEGRIVRRQKNVTDATGAHAQRFVECVRTRQAPPADAWTGHRGTNIAHLGNISYKTGMKLTWDADKELFVDAPEANRLLGRAARKPWDLLKG